MKRKARGIAEIIGGIWAGLLIVRLVLMVARLVGVIGAADTLAEWAGHPGAIVEFEAWFDSWLGGWHDR